MSSPRALPMQALRPCETQRAGLSSTVSATPCCSAAARSSSTEPSVEPPSATSSSSSPSQVCCARSPTIRPTCPASFSIGTMTEIRFTGLTGPMSSGSDQRGAGR